MDEAIEKSQSEHEWRTSVTAIRAAAEILRDYDGLATWSTTASSKRSSMRAAGSRARSRTSTEFPEARVFAAVPRTWREPRPL
jgi:hypothetical protein